MSQPTHDSGNVDAMDVRESFDRIELLLNRGQQLLYGDEAGADGNGVAAAVTSPDGEPADAGAVPTGYADPAQCSPVHSSQPPHPRTTMPPSGATGLPPRGAAAAPGPSSASPYGGLAPPASRAQQDQENSYQRLLAQSNAGHPPAGATGSKLRGSRVRGRTQSLAIGGKRRAARPKQEDEADFSASVRGRMIVQLQKEGGRVPNLEEGVDAGDTAQNYTIAELKARIRRELEEYQRNGPLMQRRESFVQRSRTAASRVATGAAAPSAGVKSSKRPAESRVTAPPAMTGALVRKQVRTVPASVPASKAAKRPVAAQPKAKSVGGTPATTTALHRQTPFWERLYRDAATQQERRDQRVEQRRVAEEKARTVHKARRANPAAAPVHSTYSAYYRPLQLDAASRSHSRDRSAKSRSGTNGTIVPPQHTSYVPRPQAHNGAAAGMSASKSSLISTHSTGEVPARVAAPRRASTFSGSPNGSKSMVGAASASPAAPSPLPLKPKTEMPSPTQVHAEAQAQSHEPFGDDIAEISSPDDEDECDNSASGQPYITPLDFTGIKK